jgi:hypothetical protein
MRGHQRPGIAFGVPFTEKPTQITEHYSTWCAAPGENLSKRERASLLGGPTFLWFTEAPVGIEPTNGGFAVLPRLLRGFLYFPKPRHGLRLARPTIATDLRLFASFSAKPSQNLPMRPSVPVDRPRRANSHDYKEPGVLSRAFRISGLRRRWPRSHRGDRLGERGARARD